MVWYGVTGVYILDKKETKTF